MELEKMKNETNAKFQKIETEYDAMRQDLRTLDKKIEEGVQKCLDDSDKLVKSTHQHTITLHKVLDKRFVLNLFNKMQAGIIEEDVRATLRLGRLTVQGFADTATGRAGPPQIRDRYWCNLLIEWPKIWL